MGMIQLRDINLEKAKRNKSPDRTWRLFQEMGLLDGSSLKDRNYSGVDGVWAGKPAYVIGTGKGLKNTLAAVGGWEFFRGKHTIGINHAIEDWDGFEWFLFLDERFIKRTTYDLGRYRGLIFAQATTGMKPSGNVKVFFCQRRGPSELLKDGLFNGNLSGLAALNLAICSGADPIYLIGNGGDGEATAESYHYKENYTAEIKEPKRLKKFQNVLKYFDHFAPWSPRIIHVSKVSDIPTFKRIDHASFAARHKLLPRVEARTARIVHLSFSDDIKVHADITRHIISECVGKHTIIDARKGIPPADMYIAEHFLSTTQAINAMTPAQKAKTINIVHTVNVLPQGTWGKTIALTEAWKRWLQKHLIKVDRVIVPGIDLAPYRDVTPDYSAQVFGRMTRWSASKVHPEWNRATLEILAAVPGSRCVMFTEKPEGGSRPFLKNERITYDHSCRIDMFKGDFLCRLSVYVHANGSFKETLSFAVIEAMATGLPIVYLDEGTGVLEEVTGCLGIRCATINAVRDSVIELLRDTEKRKALGAKCREFAFSRYDKTRMVSEFNALIEEELRR
jgi:glycosyltransferase involved in cell wall biosynthesis